MIICGDSLIELKNLPENSVDSVVTDPPYGLSFMGKKWDYDVPSKELWQEILRVLKPGGYLLSFAGTRTQHRMAVNIEDAGFEIRDMIAWVYGSGFPKSLNISKSIDKRRLGDKFHEFRAYLKDIIIQSGKTHEEITDYIGKAKGSGLISHWITTNQDSINYVPNWVDYQKLKEILPFDDRYDYLMEDVKRDIIGLQKTNLTVMQNIGGLSNNSVIDITTATTDEAKQYEGWGTALKPALEPITVARKPLSEKTIADNLLKHGTGGINIDGSRIETLDNLSIHKGNLFAGNSGIDTKQNFKVDGQSLGRFPANLIHDGSDEVSNLFPRTTTGGGDKINKDIRGVANGGIYGNYHPNPKAYIHKLDSGSAARFFYCAKASKADRDEGLDSTTLVDITKVCKDNNTTVEEKLTRFRVTGILPLKVTEESGTKYKSVSEWSMSWFGNEYTDKYLESFKSTILMETNLTTTSLTLKWLIHLLTNDYIQGVKLEMESGGNLVESVGDYNTLTITISEQTALALGVKDAQSPVQLRINVKDGNNTHSTVKPTKLMQYLVKLVTPKGGTVLDPFMGSGSTGKAAKLEGFDFIGIELDPEYCKIAEARISAIKKGLF